MSGRAKRWAEPGLPVEERAERAWRGSMFSSNPDDHVAVIAEAMRAVRKDALEEAARALEAAHFLFAIQRPGTGPFTRQDQTMREVVEQGAACIRAAKDQGR